MKNVKVMGWVSMLFLLIAVVSCRKDNIEPDTTVKVTIPEVRVEASIAGQVYDENLEPLAGVSIKIGSDFATTDEYGQFRILDKVFNEKGTLVTAVKENYFLGAKMFNPSLAKESYVEIQLLNKNLTGTFNSQSGGELTTSDGASVNFGANSISYENGTPYTGEVNVYSKWIDPSSEFLAEQMPGDLRAIDAEEEFVQLATYGMVAVELEAPNGTKLQITDGQKATLSMPVPAELLGSAPTTIPLWSFDETNGHWIEEATATLVGNKYIGDVPHFSFWNCDAPFPLIELTGTVLYTNGDAVSNTKVTLTRDGAATRAGWTNSAGEFGGKVPKDEVMTLEVFDNCNESVYTAEVGPWSVDTDLADIVIDVLDLLTITGNLVKCDGSPVTNGYALIRGEGPLVSAYVDDANGAFSMSIDLCEDGTLELAGYDLDIPLTSEVLTIDGTVAGGTYDAGDISVCENLDEYIIVTIPSISYFNEISDYEVDETAGFKISTEPNTDSLYFAVVIDVPVTGSGTYTSTNVDYWDWEFNQPNEGIFLYCLSTCPDTEITEYGGAGGYASGTITGEMGLETSGGGNVDVEISFRVKL